MKNTFIILICSVFLFGCPKNNDIDPKNLANELVGTYAATIPANNYGVVFARHQYLVTITSSKKDEVNLTIKRTTEVRDKENAPFKSYTEPEIATFENGYVVSTKKFIIDETRNTDWYENYKSTSTKVNIEGKLTGSDLSLDVTYAYPAYKKSDEYTVTLKKN